MSVNFAADALKEMHGPAMACMERAGRVVVYAVDTKPYAHVWAVPDPYDTAPEAVTELWRGECGDRIKGPLRRAFTAHADGPVDAGRPALSPARWPTPTI